MIKRLWNSFITILFGFGIIGIGFLLIWDKWNPISEYKLIKQGVVVKGQITDCVEEVNDNDRGQAIFEYRCSYNYTTLDNQTIASITPSYQNQLPDELQSLPYDVNVTYLQNEPLISKITDSGSTSLTDWFFRKVICAPVLLLLFIIPGVQIINMAIKSFLKKD